MMSPLCVNLKAIMTEVNPDEKDVHIEGLHSLTLSNTVQHPTNIRPVFMCSDQPANAATNATPYNTGPMAFERPSKPPLWLFRPLRLTRITRLNPRVG